MKKQFLLLISLVWAISQGLNAQNAVSIYNPDADAEVELKNAIVLASETKKHVLVQVGGNWCPWCVKLHEFMKTDSQLDSILKADYVIVKLNYSKENKNEVMLAALDYPQRFGFPVLVILNADGKRLHTQNTGYLEEGKGYSKDKVYGFLKDWRPKALAKESYMK